MKFVELFSGMRIFKEVLDFFQNSKTEAIRERTDDLFTNGVLENALNNMGIIGKDADALLQVDRVKVDTGIAYFAGERVLIDDATIAYDATKISDTTDNGKGLPVATPHSTGSFDIPITLGVINYLYIAYLQTTDETQFSLQKRTSEKLFYKRTDGYEVQINTTGVNPDSNRFIFLGQVDATGGTGTIIASNISLVGRAVTTTDIRRIGIETANLTKTDRPSSYALGNKKLLLDDHIKSVDNGLVSPINPHGLDILDLGVAPNQTVEEHRKLEHSKGNAIVAGNEFVPFPTISAMYAQKIDTAVDYLSIRALISSEVIIVNGIGFSSTTFPSDVALYMTDDGTSGGTPLASDTYQIVYDASTQLVLPPIAGTATPINLNYLWLATVAWDSSSSTIIGTPLDRRRIGGTVNKLQRWSTAGRPNPAIASHFGYNVDTNKLEYYNGSSWIELG